MRALSNETQEWAVGQWRDGRIGTLRGNRTGGSDFYAVLHRERGSTAVHALGGQYEAGQQNLLRQFLLMAGGTSACKPGGDSGADPFY